MNPLDGESSDLNQILSSATLIYSEAEVDAAVSQLADKINADYATTTPLVLCVMNGGLIATAKIVSQLCMPIQMDYIHATRYGHSTSGQSLNWIADPKSPLRGRDVILIDDILDEGITLQALFDFCESEQVASVKAALLVKKDHDRCLAPELGQYVGLTVPDKYVFGCGMDYKGYFRNLPAIYALES